MRLSDRAALGVSLAVVAIALVSFGVSVGVGAVDVPAVLDLPRPTASVADGYDRGEFGTGWADADGDGCDTRDEVLARDALGAAFGPDGCVEHVVILDPYTGEQVDGRAEIDIDHAWWPSPTPGAPGRTRGPTRSGRRSPTMS